MNKELTRKLEAQTQRLELLMAQSMANDSNQPRHQDIRPMHESTTYADEGDEVIYHQQFWAFSFYLFIVYGWCDDSFFSFSLLFSFLILTCLHVCFWCSNGREEFLTLVVYVRICNFTPW